MMPLLINSLDRSIQLSEAIECRGFKTTGTPQLFNYTKMPLSIQILLAIHFMMVAALLYFFITQGFGYWQIIPSLNPTPFQAGHTPILALLLGSNLIELLLLWLRWKK
jgi:hypothetical protein